MTGWIKSYRKKFDNPIVCKDSDHYVVWDYLLHFADPFAGRPISYAGRTIKLESGQLVIGQMTISENFPIDQSKVWECLKDFEEAGQISITCESDCDEILITILAWGKYQNGCNNKRNINKDIKEGINKNNKKKKTVAKATAKENAFFCDPAVNNAFLEFIEDKKERGKPMTERAIKIAVTRLNKLSDDPEAQIEAIENAIISSWGRIFLPKGDTTKTANNTHSANDGYCNSSQNSARPTKNGFHNFEERNTDYDAIMMQQVKGWVEEEKRKEENEQKQDGAENDSVRLIE